MIIRVLVINTTNCELQGQHGLSLYLDGRDKVLFDMGQNDLFIENAKKMGIDLSNVGIAIISHGHYDHGGGLQAFLDINHQARVYLHKDAFCRFYSNQLNGKKYIGLEKVSSKQFIYTSSSEKINDELTLFAEIKGTNEKPILNRKLFKELENDDFMHEQSLLISGSKNILIAGCAHCGIINIVEEIEKRSHLKIDAVIAGFHLSASGFHTDKEFIQSLALELKKKDIMYYTGHCVSIEDYQILKEILGDKIAYLNVGDEIIIKEE